MRLLSFLTEIERAIMMEANAAEGTVWDAARIVNFQTGLARLTITPAGMPGSFCVKTSLQWAGATVPVVLSVYETPVLNWKMEASRIAATWLAGPPAEAPSVTAPMSLDTPLEATGTER